MKENFENYWQFVYGLYEFFATMHKEQL